MTHRQRQPDFTPIRGQLCFCGSGALFGDCCGSLGEDRKPPFGVHLVRSYLDLVRCRRWVKHLEQQPRQPLMVVDTKKSTPQKLVKMPDHRRVTQEVESTRLNPEIWATFRQAYATLVRKAFNRRIAWF